MNTMSHVSNPAIKSFTQRRKDSPGGAGHYHVADRFGQRMSVTIAGHEVASSDRVIILKEVGTSVYNPVFYFPREDVQMDQFEKVPGRSTHCPIKGDASYWSFVADRQRVENAAWSYENPLPYSDMIAGYLGFDLRFASLCLFSSENVEQGLK